MALDSMKEIFERSARENIPFWEIVLQYDMEERQVSRQASMAKMLSTWQAIQDAADSYTGTQRSVSGLVGGDGLKMRLYARRGESIGGEFMDEVIVQAISMAESNACMRRIVAAPTAGSCGVVPAVLLPLCEREHYTQHELLEALYVASGIGAVIAYRASISGAAGGCQAEIGTASAMAAGALVALRGGSGALIGQDTYPEGAAQSERTITFTLPTGVAGIPFVAVATDANGYSSEFSPAFDVIFEDDFE